MDLLHAQHPFISGSLAVIYGKRYGVPVIFTNHTRYDKLAPHYVPVLPGGVSEALLEAYLPWFANQCQAVTAPTQAILRLLREYGVTVRMLVIPNGVDGRGPSWGCPTKQKCRCMWDGSRRRRTCHSC